MALLLRIVGDYILRPPTYAVRIHVTWDRHWSQNLVLTTLRLGSTVGEQFTELTPKGPYYANTLRSWTVNLQQGTLQPQPYGEQFFDRPELGPFQPNRGWTWSYNLNLIGQDVVVGEASTALTVKPYEYAVQLRSWTWAYNLNLIGQDAFPSGERSLDLTVKPYEYAAQLRSWAWSYNLNLIGKDRLPVGAEITDLTQRPYEYHVQQRSWLWNYNLNLIGQDAFPVGETTNIVPKAPEYHVQFRTWAWMYNLNLTGQDRLPVGEIIWERPPLAPSLFQQWINDTNLALSTVGPAPFYQLDWPLTPAPQRAATLSTWIDQVKLLLAVPFGQSDWPVYRPLPPQARTWTWSYNLNLIGQDLFPTGAEVTALPPQPPLSAIQLRTWINSLALGLATGAIQPFSQSDWPLTPAAIRPNNLSTWIDQTKLLLAVPFKQLDWPTPPPQPRTALSWAAWYNLNLIGQDKLPAGEIVTDLPPRAPLQPTPIFVASYNKNLIGKDELPVGDDVWEIPQRDYQRSVQLYTWIQTVNLALTTQAATLPFNQYDWPNPTLYVRQARTFTGFYNLDLLGQDKLPFRQQDWPNPTQPFRSPTLASWIDRAKSYLQRPHRQTDWPNPYPAVQPNRSYGYAFQRVLIGQDKLPFRQQDWPTPRNPFQPYNHGPREFSNGINLPLNFPPITGGLPFSQFSWPLPQQPPVRWQRHSIEYQGNNLLPIYVSPIPPVPPPSPPEDVRLIYNAGNEWQMLDRIREPGPVGWR